MGRDRYCKSRNWRGFNEENQERRKSKSHVGQNKEDWRHYAKREVKCGPTTVMLTETVVGRVKHKGKRPIAERRRRGWNTIKKLNNDTESER
ncbi:hypothetical protein NDU88_003268 [Pleurodeles waltl]|uniref:Uncharacterized protein n=1 Tax=Pleurodeles waltl TaxID=8319 RepID=A0AAV7WNY9_PLEWA|nr:hypothetical protein NDU88_003268 [Pleurodeles waltl]